MYILFINNDYFGFMREYTTGLELLKILDKFQEQIEYHNQCYKFCQNKKLI